MFHGNVDTTQESIGLVARENNRSERTEPSFKNVLPAELQLTASIQIFPVTRTETIQRLFPVHKVERGDRGSWHFNFLLSLSPATRDADVKPWS